MLHYGMVSGYHCGNQLTQGHFYTGFKIGGTPNDPAKVRQFNFTQKKNDSDKDAKNLPYHPSSKNENNNFACND